jgi:uncharacterized protein YjiS (DUF1127 family)
MAPGYSRGSVSAGRPALEDVAASFVTRAARWVVAAFAVARERHQLGDLDDRMLKDIGITRRMAERESARDLLDVPTHRIGHY